MAHDVTPDCSPEEENRMREAFQESEEIFRTLAETTTAAILIYQGDAWVYANPAAERISGYSRNELLGMNFWEIVHPDFQQHVRNLGRTRMQSDHTPPAHIELRILRTDGTERWLDVTCGTATFRNGKAGVLTAIDITERKDAEANLIESGKRYRAVFDSLDDLYYQTDMDGIITALSPSCKKLTGFSPDELIGRQVLGLYPFPEQRESLLGKLQADSQVYDYEIVLRDRQGKNLSVSVNCHIVRDTEGRPIRIEGTLRDITPRKQMEQALRENEEMLQTVFNNANDAIFVHELLPDKMPGRYVRVNDRACRNLGYTREELLTLSPKDIVSPEHRKKMPELSRVIQARSHATFDAVHKRKDGSEYPVEVSTHLFTLQGKELALSIARDITERKKIEQERLGITETLANLVRERTRDLERTNVRLEEEIQVRQEAEKNIQASLAEKEVLLREIHHRVKNNLQIIVSLLSLQSRYIEDKKTLDALKESQNRVKAMAIIHEKLYKSEDVSSIDMGSYADMLTRHLFQFYGVMPGRVRLALDVKRMNVTINTAIPLGLIINELFSNALKYAFPDGRTGEITISARKDQDGIFLQFRDNGVGLPEGYDWRDPHSLGLRLVLTLVEQLSGTIDLDRSSGTAYTIRLRESREGRMGSPG